MSAPLNSPPKSTLVPEQKCCTSPGCTRPVWSRNLCGTHYKAGYRKGTLPPGEVKLPPVVRRLHFPPRLDARIKALAAARGLEMKRVIWLVIQTGIETLEKN